MENPLRSSNTHHPLQQELHHSQVIALLAETLLCSTRPQLVALLQVFDSQQNPTLSKGSERPFPFNCPNSSTASSLWTWSNLSSCSSSACQYSGFLKPAPATSFFVGSYSAFRNWAFCSGVVFGSHIQVLQKDTGRILRTSFISFILQEFEGLPKLDFGAMSKILVKIFHKPCLRAKLRLKRS
jgi:hypothetical protein